MEGRREGGVEMRGMQEEQEEEGAGRGGREAGMGQGKGEGSGQDGAGGRKPVYVCLCVCTRGSAGPREEAKEKVPKVTSTRASTQKLSGARQNGCHSP